MNYCNIKPCDTADGEGVRVTLFVSGCPLHCFNCQNKVAWDYNYGEPFTEQALFKIFSYLDKDYISGFTLCGGEPLCPNNYKTCLYIVKNVRAKFGNKKSIWCYTGYELDELPNKEILDYIDVIITGRYVDSLRDISHNNEWRGSTNQKIIYLHNNRENIYEINN